MAVGWRASGSRILPQPPEATITESIALVDAELASIGSQALDPVLYEQRCNQLLDLRAGLMRQRDTTDG